MAFDPEETPGLTMRELENTVEGSLGGGWAAEGALTPLADVMMPLKAGLAKRCDESMSPHDGPELRLRPKSQDGGLFRYVGHCRCKAGPNPGRCSALVLLLPEASHTASGGGYVSRATNPLYGGVAELQA